jgi:RNA polymerase sigma-70 factor (ECF subfamily)
MTAPPFYEEDRSGNSSRIENALRKLPEHQREALILIAAGGFSYAEVARIAGVQIGTIKSRVARGRLSLSRILAGDLPVPRQNKTTSKGLESSHPGGW